MLGKINESVVEARQADNLFKKLVADSTGKAFYRDDGFVRYLMGLIYENAGYINDALISYKLALKAYPNTISKTPAPDDLINSLYNAYLSLSMFDEAKNLKDKYPFVKKNNFANNGELIVVNYNGISPKKNRVLPSAVF
jgi:tetratricopeptide (TPR) repeat protein